jgi:hypothetical protein
MKKKIGKNIIKLERKKRKDLTKGLKNKILQFGCRHVFMKKRIIIYTSLLLIIIVLLAIFIFHQNLRHNSNVQTFKSNISPSFALSSIAKINIASSTYPIDSEFATSSDNKKVVFIRDVGDHRTSQDFAEGIDNFNQIIVRDLVSQKEEIILKSGNLTNFKIFNLPNYYPIDIICDVGNLLLSSNSDRAFFATAAWVTSPAVFSVDLKTKELRYITDGEPIKIVTSGKFKGDLVVNQRHRVEKDGGYEDYCDYVIDPNNGKRLEDLNSCLSDSDSKTDLTHN